MKTCPRCKQSFEDVEKHFHKKNISGYQTYCKSCNRLYYLESIRPHKEFIKPKLITDFESQIILSKLASWEKKLRWQEENKGYKEHLIYY